MQQSQLQVVRDHFLRYGIKSVTMDDIARHLGISKKTLYQSIDNKQDLLEKIFQQHIAEEKEAIAAIREEAKDAVHEMVEIGRYVLQLLRTMSPTVLYDLNKYYLNIYKMMERLHQEYIYEVIRENIQRGQEEGLYRQDMDREIIARLYTSSNILLVDEHLFPMAQFTRHAIYAEYMRYHIRGIALPKGIKLLEKYTKSA